MTTNQTFQIGQKIHTLPDCGTLTITTIGEGVEHGDSVVYVTGVNSLGQSITRWVRR